MHALDVPRSNGGVGGARSNHSPLPITITVDKSEFGNNDNHRQASFLYGRVEQSFDSPSTFGRRSGDDDLFRVRDEMSGSHLDDGSSLAASTTSSGAGNDSHIAGSFDRFAPRSPQQQQQQALSPFRKYAGGGPFGGERAGGGTGDGGNGARRRASRKASINFLVSFDDFARDDDDVKDDEDDDCGPDDHGGEGMHSPESPGGRRARGSHFSVSDDNRESVREPVGSPLRSTGGGGHATGAHQSLPTVTMDFSRSVRARRSVVQSQQQSSAVAGRKSLTSVRFRGNVGQVASPELVATASNESSTTQLCSPTPQGSRSRPSPRGSVDGVSSPRSPPHNAAPPCIPTEPPKRTQPQSGTMTVRERAMMARIAEHDRKELDLLRSNERQALAEENKLFHREHRHLQLEASWMTYLAHAAVIAALRSIVTSIRSTRNVPRRTFFPIIALRLRQALRRVRTRILGRTIVRPSLAVLRSDKMMNLFPDTQLQHAVDHMTLKYYFNNELVIMMGSEDSEAYILESGCADVVMGTTKVFTLRPKMSFGTVGMISGEPRTASIITREPSLVWVIQRDVFNAGGGSGAADQEKLAAAHAAINELRQQNMLNVYKRQLDPSTLGYFPLFNGLSHETLVSITTNGTRPRVARGGTALVAANQPLQHVAPFILLRGSVVVKLSKSAWVGRNAHNKAPLHELLRQLFDLPQRRSRGIGGGGGGGGSTVHPAFSHLESDLDALFSEAAAVLAQQQEVNELSCALNPGMLRRATAGNVASVLSSSGREGDDGGGDATSSIDLCVVDAPALFQLAPMFFIGGTLSLPFTVVAKKDCDIMGIGRSALRSQDVLELAVVRQNALNLHCEFMKPPSRVELCKVWFRDVATTSSAAAANIQSVTSKCLKALSGHSSNSGGASGGPLLPSPPNSSLSADHPQGHHYHHHHHQLTYEKWVVAPQDHLMFDPQSDFKIYIVLRGELEAHGSLGTAELRAPFIWPPMSFAWYGTRNLTARAKTHVDVLRIRRNELLSFVCREVLSEFTNSAAAATTAQHFARTSASHEMLHGLVKALAADYHRQTQTIPSLSNFGLDEEPGGSALHGTISSTVASVRGGGGITTRKKSLGGVPISFARKRSVATSFSGAGGGSSRSGSVAALGYVDSEPLWLIILRALTVSATSSLRKANNASSAVSVAVAPIPTTAGSAPSAKRQQHPEGKGGHRGKRNSSHAYDDDDDTSESEDDNSADEDDSDDSSSQFHTARGGGRRRSSGRVTSTSDTPKKSVTRTPSSGWMRPSSSSPHGRPLFQTSSVQPRRNQAERPNSAMPLGATGKSKHSRGGGRGGGGAPESTFLVKVPSSHDLLRSTGSAGMDSPMQTTTMARHCLSPSAPKTKHTGPLQSPARGKHVTSRSSSSANVRQNAPSSCNSSNPASPTTGRAYDFLLDAVRPAGERDVDDNRGRLNNNNNNNNNNVAIQYLPVRHKVPKGGLGHQARTTPAARK